MHHTLEVKEGDQHHFSSIFLLAHFLLARRLCAAFLICQWIKILDLHFICCNDSVQVVKLSGNTLLSFQTNANAHFHRVFLLHTRNPRWAHFPHVQMIWQNSKCGIIWHVQCSSHCSGQHVPIIPNYKCDYITNSSLIRVDFCPGCETKQQIHDQYVCHLNTVVLLSISSTEYPFSI